MSTPWNPLLRFRPEQPNPSARRGFLRAKLVWATGEPVRPNGLGAPGSGEVFSTAREALSLAFFSPRAVRSFVLGVSPCSYSFEGFPGLANLLTPLLLEAQLVGKLVTSLGRVEDWRGGP